MNALSRAVWGNKRKAASCHDCGSTDTVFAHLYRFRWFRKLRRRVKIRCRACRRSWYCVYP